MESNREEAVRAKEIAEKKLKENDIEGAREFGRKAQNLFPGLEGLSQFLATIAIYVSAQNKVAGEVDRYMVLGVDPSDDDETIRKHFRKMAFTLHPDRNKSFGSEGAFKVLSEAWSILSDKCKRQAYDLKRGVQQRVVGENQSTPARMNGNVHTFPNNSNISARDQKTSVSNSDIGPRDQKTSTNPQSNPVAPRPSKTKTFWTTCISCHMKYKYLKIYLNQKLRCPNCRESFVALEIPDPPTNNQHTSIPWATCHQQKKVNRDTTNSPASHLLRKPASALNVGTLGSAVVRSSNKVNVGHGPFSKSGNIGSGSAPVTLAAHVVQPACVTLKRGYEEEQTAATKEEALFFNSSMKSGIGLAPNVVSSSGERDRTEKKRRLDEQNRKVLVDRMAMGSGMYYQESINICQKKSFKAEIDGISGIIKPTITRNFSKAEICNMLMGKARMEIRKKLNEWTAATKDLNEGGKEMKKKKLKSVAYDVEKSTVNGWEKDGNMNEARLSTKPKKHLFPAASLDSQAKAADFMSMSVPDSDFHDFDMDRIEKSFGENQVWAAYDDSDGMPRFYALIHSVSKRPFKMRISWLNSRSNNELGTMNWIGSGFYKTSGDFWVGKHEVNNKLNSFSHRVKWTKGKRGVIQIFPRKGDVWALYRNWSSDWNEYTTLEVIQKYDAVEVLEDYNEERGVTIAPLVKVSGFKSVFRQQPGEVRTIPKQEIFRFSHRVLSYLITGQEATNAPKGYLELDPAALPLELLQVITEANDQEAVQNAEKVVKQDGMEGVQQAKGE